MSFEVSASNPRADLPGRIGAAILEIAASIPHSNEVPSAQPTARAAALARTGAQRAATISGSAALVPGPLGFLSLLPDIMGVWRVQAQMVADIAAVYGKSATLSREQMLYCLFRHLLSHGFGDVVAHAGERFLVRKASLHLLQKLAKSIGVKVSQQVMSKTIARYAPLVGAAGIASYAYFDTKKVARTAIELFAAEITLEPAGERSP